MRNLNMEIHLHGVDRDQLTPLPFGPHLCNDRTSQCWKRALTLPEAFWEAVTAANAVINQSGSGECLRGKFSNAILRLSNSCDVSGHSSTACEWFSEMAG